MLSDRIIDKAVESLSSRLKIGNEVIVRDGEVHLDTTVVVGSRVVYRHSLSLEPVLEEFQSRLDSNQSL